MPSLNSCAFIGNLGKDPELKYTSSGAAVATFSLAVNRNFKDKDGNWQQDTQWFNVVCWADLAERAAEYLRKGRLVYIEGRLQNRTYQTEEGQKRYVTEIIANKAMGLDRAEEGAPQDAKAAPVDSAAHGDSSLNDLDELPF